MIINYRTHPERILSEKTIRTLIINAIHINNNTISKKMPGCADTAIIINEMAYLTQELQKITFTGQPSDQITEAIAKASLGIDYLCALHNFDTKELFVSKFSESETIADIAQLIQTLSKSLYENINKVYLIDITSRCATDIQMLQKLYTDRTKIQIIKSIKMKERTIINRIKSVMQTLSQLDNITDFKLEYNGETIILNDIATSKAYEKCYHLAIDNSCDAKCFLYFKIKQTTAARPVFEVIDGDAYITGIRIS